MYDSIHYALDATDITKVYWACYLSEYFGVIDKYSYLKNPGFNVLYSYARLPLNVVKVDNYKEQEEKPSEDQQEETEISVGEKKLPKTGF